MKQSIIHIALVVRDYDEALDYQPDQDKRWVVVAPPSSIGVNLLLAKASKPEQFEVLATILVGVFFYFKH